MEVLAPEESTVSTSPLRDAETETETDPREYVILSYIPYRV